MSSARASTSSNSDKKGEGAAFDEFYSEVKQIEKRDSVLTSKQQIERLLRPGSTYFNLNPFEVLQVDPDTSIDEIKTKYRRLSILVHPDKNQDDPERASLAFEAVNKAWKTLENGETRQRCMDVVEEAKARTDISIAEKKKKLKKDGKSTYVEEDDPAKYKQAIHVMIMKQFAELERKRRNLEDRNQQEAKRKREGEIEEEEKHKAEKIWAKNFEESREGRVSSWKSFQSGAKSTKSKTPKGMFRPPKFKPESR